MPKTKEIFDLIGRIQKSNGLTFLCEDAVQTFPSGRTLRTVRCLCECGRETVVTAGHYRRGHTTSCGCRQKLYTTIRNFKHGFSARGQNKYLYHTWQHIKSRCYNENNPDYKDYGGRGIAMAAEWIEDCLSFASYVGQRPTTKHSIDRINNNGNYEPGNVRWASQEQQARNKRTTRVVPYKGSLMSLTSASEMAGLPIKAVRGRLDRGWSIEDALSAPIRSRANHLPSGDQSQLLL